MSVAVHRAARYLLRMIRVHIAIDTQAIRWAFATVLRREDGLEVVGDTEAGRAGAAFCAAVMPDVVVTSDCYGDLPERVVEQYRAACPPAKVVLLMVAGQAADLTNNAGADAALDAMDGTDGLVAAIRSVAPR